MEKINNVTLNLLGVLSNASFISRQRQLADNESLLEAAYEVAQLWAQEQKRWGKSLVRVFVNIGGIDGVIEFMLTDDSFEVVSAPAGAEDYL